MTALSRIGRRYWSSQPKVQDMSTSRHESALIPSDSVRVVQNQDGAVLLDIRQGLCLSMTFVGVKIWDLLRLKCSVDQITEALVTEFNVPRQQVYEDVTAFVSDLTQKGLLLSNKSNKRARFLPNAFDLIVGAHRVLQCKFYNPSRALRFLSWKAFIAVLAFDMSRFSSNFPRMHKFVQSWTVAPSLASPDAVDRACHAVNWACVWYPKRVLCLQRSAVLTCLLRNCGVPAEMVMGAQRIPFSPHAWTEVQGSAINERRNVHALYEVWDRC
jgi:hypothetical protein